MSADMSQAACAGMDVNFFFDDYVDNRDMVHRVCGSCPVRKECLAEALESNQTHGIWGGKATHERREMNDRQTNRVAKARRHQIRDLLGTGMTRAEIADRMDVDVRTVRRALTGES